MTKQKTTVIDFSINKQAIEINPVNFEGKTIRFISAKQNQYKIGEEINVSMENGIIPSIHKIWNLELEISTSEDYKHLTSNGVSSIPNIKLELPLLEFQENPGNYIVIVKHAFFGVPFYLAYPKEYNEKERKNLSFGGNFIFSKDSRFPSKFPIHLIDNIKN